MPRYKIHPINGTDFQFEIPKLIQVEGGMVLVTLEFAKQPQDFEIVAIYDQGSAKAKEFDYYQNLFWRLFWIWIFLIVAGVGETLFFIYFFWIRKRKQYSEFLLKNFTRIRRTLIKSPDYNGPFKRDWEMKLVNVLEPKEDKFARTIRLSTKYIKHVPDFVKVDDVLQLISKREEKRNTIDIHNLNSELLNSINNVLQRVNWEKYD
jgi:hypothetical protein